MDFEAIERDTRRLGNALQRLSTALSEPEASSKSWQDTSQAFEYAMDMFWKVSKDLLTARGFEVHMPREALQKAHERGWIEDTSLWIEMLKDEYELSGSNHSHVVVQRIYPRLRTYYPEMSRVFDILATRIAELRTEA